MDEFLKQERERSESQMAFTENSNIWEPNLCRMPLSEKYYQYNRKSNKSTFDFEWPQIYDLERIRDKGQSLGNLKLQCINMTIFDGSPIDMIFKFSDQVHSTPCTAKLLPKAGGQMIRIHIDQSWNVKKIQLYRHRAFPQRFFGMRFIDNDDTVLCEQIWWKGYIH